MTEQNKAVEADDCNCAEVLGEDPNCPLHGIEADWSLKNRDAAAWQQICIEYRDMHRDLEARPTQTADAVEAARRAAIDAICTAELPYEWQSCGRDDSGIALTLQRQRHWTLDAVEEAFTALTRTATSEVTPTHDSALQSNSDSELLREVADRAAEFVAACKPMIYPKPDKPETDYGRMVALEKALARLEQGAA